MCERQDTRGDAPFLAGASLTHLPKLPSGIRPIAAGEILRRIIAKATLSNAMAQLADFFGDFQLGVGRKGGIKHIVFAINKLVAENVDNPDFVGVKVDMKNAFNALFRTKMLTAARRFPILAHWLATCYGSDSHLWFGEFVLSSQKGVQQGDPLGPLLFALTLMETINEIQGLRPLLNKWYLDDGVIFGTHETIAAVIKVLESPSLTGLGLELNASKCELIWLRPEFVCPEAFPFRCSNRITDGKFIRIAHRFWLCCNSQQKGPSRQQDFHQNRKAHSFARSAAVQFAIANLDLPPTRDALILIDNQSVVNSLKKGSSPMPSINHMIKKLVDRAGQTWLAWIPSAANWEILHKSW